MNLNAFQEGGRIFRETAIRLRHELASAFTKIEMLQRRLETLRAQQVSMVESPAWEFVEAYRRWLRATVWPRPWLCSCYEPIVGGLLRQLTKRRRQEPNAADIDSHTAAPRQAASAGVSSSSAQSGNPRLAWDEPRMGATVWGHVGIRGWAIDASGIDSIELWDGDDILAHTTESHERADVQALSPGVAGTLQSGFYMLWDSTEFPPGRLELRVIARAKGGGQAEIRRHFVVDHRASEEIWIQENEPTASQKQQMLAEVTHFRYRPKLSIVTPAYKTPEGLLSACAGSVVAQVYPDWEHCLVDDGSNDRSLTRLMKCLPALDSRIKVRTLTSNRGIAGATNAAIEMCAGEYVGFLDHDDELADTALFEVVRALNQDPSIDVLYSDEDKVGANGHRYNPFFKPEWSPDLLRSCNYITHFLVVRRTLLEEVGGLRMGFDGSQDYELILRLSEKTERIIRIPKLLYHWRSIEGSAAHSESAKPESSDRGRAALVEHLSRCGEVATVAEIRANRYRVRYVIQDRPHITIVIPTGDSIDKLTVALQSVLTKSTYDNYEIAIVDNSSGSRVEELVRSVRAGEQRVRYMDHRSEEFNFSRLCNQAVRDVESPFVLFLNDDTEVISTDWMEALLEHGQRPKVGAVGAQLLFPDGRTQHAGVVLGLLGCCGHAFRGLISGGHHYFEFPNMVRNVSAVTAACVLIPTKAFREVGGFNEKDLPVAFQDIDICLRLHERGDRIVYTPFAKLYHHEGASRSERPVNPREVEYMREVWAKYMMDDPYYSPNLTRRSEHFGCNLDP